LTLLEIILIIMAISFAVFVTVGQIKVLYRRHLKSYKLEIENHLKNQGLTLQTVCSPTINDWKNSPFEKPQRVGISFFVIQINGVIVTWNDQKYKVIQTNEEKIVWLEIDTTYFKRPNLTFKIVRKMKSIKTKKKINYGNIKR
jgi:hypothetical protein